MASFYDPLVYHGKRLTGAAAMNVRLAQAGGADNFAHKLVKDTINALTGLVQINTSAGNSNVVPLRTKRRTG